VKSFISRLITRKARPIVYATFACAAALFAPAAASAAEGWSHWWLPPNYSTHGGAIDALFTWTFWITMVTFVLVEATLIVFLVKYRSRPDRKKAIFTHGNTRLEMAWTLAPAVILAGLAVANKGVWDRFRFNPEGTRADKATILVIGEQFKWNVIYPGKDGKLGRYLIYPKPTDKRWPGGVKFAGVAGPADLPYAQAVTAIKTYIDQDNPLGKDMDDPDGKDDNWDKRPGREINIPHNRPVEVQLSSKDVIHSFFLPNFRVKLDAVPGLRGSFVFTATQTSAQREKETTRPASVKTLLENLDAPENQELYISITADSPDAVKDPKRDEFLYQDKTKDPKKPVTIVRHAMPLTEKRLQQLADNGIDKINVYKPGYFELVCEELCGGQHYTMRGQVVVLSSEEYNKRFEGGRSLAPAGPTTAPAPAIATATP
jgi:heme/copper-type cytochrome/quinol oxidase subunit 2